MVVCSVAGRCGGCAWIAVPLETQRARKRDELAALFAQHGVDGAALASVAILDCGSDGLRDRTDLVWADGVLGLYEIEGGAVVPIGACPALSPRLRAFAVALAGDPPPITKASLRLRVADDGTLGLWIDAANVDVKALLDEAAWLRRQAALATIEIGQRRKPLLVEAERLRLAKEAVLAPWFSTYLSDGRAVPLYRPIGGFSQPSRAANRVLVDAVMAACARVETSTWVEIGAGNGNFTLPLAMRGARVLAVELDSLALDGLQRSARALGPDLADRIELCALDVHHRASELVPLMAERPALLVDPPRSGLRGFVDVLADLPAPPDTIVYVSCFPDSLVGDIARLATIGYRVDAIVGVDQFPQSPHIEWVATLTRTVVTPAA